MNSRVRSALLGSSLLLVACASSMERAQDSLGKGNFEDAVARFERLAADDPGNAEAQEGLRKARDGYLGAKLIQVRQARNAGDWDGAIGGLLHVIEREGAWKQPPGGPAAFTQQEEATELSREARRRVDASIKAQFPLQAELSVRKFEPILKASENVKLLGQLRSQVRAAGKAKCADFKRERLERAPYFARFVRSFCQFHGEEMRALGAGARSVSDDLVAGWAFAPAAPAEAAARFPAPARLIAESALRDALKRTAWYDPEGDAKATGKLTLDLDEKREKSGTVLSKDYKENETYYESVPVQRTRQVSYTEQVPVIDPVTQAQKMVGVQRTREESYWQNEQQQRTRQLSRTHRYPAWKHQQELKLAIGGEFAVLKHEFDAHLNEKKNVEGIEHDETFALADLKPERPALLDPAAWTTEMAKAYAAQVEERLSQLWRDLYCRAEGSKADAAATTAGEGAKAAARDETRAASGEKVFRCARQASAEPPAYVESWHQAHLGVGTIQARALLGK